MWADGVYSRHDKTSVIVSKDLLRRLQHPTGISASSDASQNAQLFFYM